MSHVRWRDLLLLSPPLMALGSAIAALQIGVSAADFCLCLLTPTSAAAIVGHMVLESWSSSRVSRSPMRAPRQLRARSVR
jgi:hypothetical protein